MTNQSTTENAAPGGTGAADCSASEYELTSEEMQEAEAVVEEMGSDPDAIAFELVWRRHHMPERIGARGAEGSAMRDAIEAVKRDNWKARYETLVAAIIDDNESFIAGIDCQDYSPMDAIDDYRARLLAKID